MDLSLITVADFKAQFRRDFPYLPTYDPLQLYNTGTRVYYPTTLLFYDCKVDGTIGIVPSDTTKWTKVSDSTDNYVLDSDIERAFMEAQVNFNQQFFTSDAQTKMVYLYVVAHYLINDIKAANGGVAATTTFLVSSRSVGNVSENYAIPPRYLAKPQFAFYATTPYGMKYLSLIMPYLVGNMGVAHGWTTP